MPDVGRSDSQRSDSSQRPRVSFNRDVHVKRIGPAGGGGSGGGGGGPRLVGALAGDGAGHLVPLAVRRERPGKLSRRQLAAEARRVLQQADRIACSSTADLAAAGDATADKHPRNFATLPPLRLGRGAQAGKSARRSLSFREPKKDKSKAAPDAVDAAAAAAVPAARVKRPRAALTRSASDAGKRDPHGGRGAPRSDAVVFASLQRPKKHRSHHSDHSDRSPSPSAKPRRHILKKSHSDSESAPAPAPDAAGEGRKKKQLSPIIEVSPREDYFGQEEMLRGATPAAPAASGRAGRSAVETMVKRLSADAARAPRRPPRGVSPSALVTPGDERRHNNNLPFSYTEPAPPGAGSPTRGGSPTGFAPQQVIYAEVVVSGGGHGQLPSKQTVHTAVPLHSDEDEGLGLSMDGFHRRADYRKEFAAEYEGVGGAEPLLDRGRADGMDARRKDPLAEESARYDAFYRGGRDGYDSAYKTTDEYSSYKMEYRNADAGVGMLRSREGSPVRKEASYHTRVLDSGDLSSRRDRLESRIESQRKDRFVTSRFADSSYKHDATDNSRIGSDIAYNNRRDFLNSQLDYERDVRHENARNARRYNDDPKKDLFADSGIEVDYRKEGSYKRYDDASNVKAEGLTAKIVIGSPPRGGENGSARVTRVELNGRRGAPPPEDEADGPGGGAYVYRASSSASAQHSGGASSFSSTRLVQEQRRSTDVLPASSVLIRHYAPKRGGSPSASERLLHSERAATAAATASAAAERGPASEDEYETRAPRREAPPDASPDPPRKADDKAKKGKDPKKKNVSAMDRVKQLFSRGGGGGGAAGDTKTLKKNKKKEGKGKSKEPAEPEEDPVRARYTEYKGGGAAVESDQETLTYRESPPPSPRRQPSPTRAAAAAEAEAAARRRDRTPSPYARSPRERSPSPAHAHAPDPHLLQVPGAHHSARPRAPHGGPAPAHCAKKTPRKDGSEIEFNYSRQRLATPDLTPTPSPAPVRAAQSSTTLTRINNHKNKEQHGGSWFKSLDRLTKRNKNKTKAKEEENSSYRDKSNSSSKTLRYFGDTDQEDKDSVASIPPPMPLQNHHRYKSSNHLGQSNSSTINRLHTSSSTSSRNTTNRSHRPHHRSAGDVATSSAESTTEGDSSQQSQRSVVYLHAATVGDIPTPKRNVTRRAQSREELSSLTSSHLQPHKKTISRSISVLAPWRPRHYREGQEVHYDQEDNNKNYIKNGKPPKIPVSQQSSLNSATMNRINRKKNLENKANASHKQHVSKATSIESLSQHSNRQNGDSRGTLKKQSLVHQAASVESLSHRSNHSISRTQNRNKSSDKKNSIMNASTSELTATYKQNNQKKNSTDTGKKGSAKISRSASMPKDTRVKAGWFKLRNKKQGT
ncbi:hypothetical protein R5R35_003635 [Gryllus longicercus]|uniref:Uncharacterized protein n=1 Tax=Gryllus longicercus TaxID=2509291 RepID=A0AAN9VSE8_9ORTH